MAAQHGALDAMFDAIEEDNVEEVRRLLDQDGGLLEAQARAYFVRDSTPLLVAARLGYPQVLRLLLERGAEVEARDEWDRTSLLIAASCGHEEVVALLLSHGADGGVIRHCGATPLRCASQQGRLGVVRLLLHHLKGRDINHRGPAKAESLWYACRWGHMEVVRALLLAGADPAITFGHRDTTPLQEAEVNGYYDTVNLLEWWEGEVERGFVVHRARYHLDQYSVMRPQFEALAACLTGMPPIPAHLRPRVQPPQVEVVALPPPGTKEKEEGEEGHEFGDDEDEDEEEGQEGSGKRKRTAKGEEGPCESEKDATLNYVMYDLAPELYMELMAAFHK